MNNSSRTKVFKESTSQVPTHAYRWVCKQKSLMVNKYDKDWFLSDMYYTKLVKDPKDYPNFKFEIIFQTFQKVRANQSF